MQLEDYFDFQRPDDIRIKGHRIGIESVLLEYLDGASPEMIRARFPTLSLEEIHATITYYYHRREQVDAYLAQYLAQSEAAQRRFDENPPPGVLRLLELKERREAGTLVGAR